VRIDGKGFPGGDRAGRKCGIRALGSAQVAEY